METDSFSIAVLFRLLRKHKTIVKITTEIRIKRLNETRVPARVEMRLDSKVAASEGIIVKDKGPSPFSPISFYIEATAWLICCEAIG